MTAILFLIFCYGMSAILAISSIAEPIRKYLKENSHWAYKFVTCPMCMSFWIALIGGFILPAALVPTIYPLFNAFLASGSSLIIHAIVWRLALRDSAF